MKSYQNLVMLQNLYRLKMSGFEYSDTVVINQKSDHILSENIHDLNKMIKECHLCDLSKSRRQSMCGSGNINADVMFIDAYVSTIEDDTNSYFSGRSGTTLAKMIENVLELSVSDVFITHGVKCKPIGNKKPSESEISSCKPYLLKQIELIKPKIIVALGEESYKMLSHDSDNFEQVRGQKINFESSIIIPIHHPNFLLRNPSLKKVAFYDLQNIKRAL